MGFLGACWTSINRLRSPRVRTLFGTTRVYEARLRGETMRVLDVDGTYQSATYLDERWCDLPFPYLRLYDCVFGTPDDALDLCMLGGGGYAYPKHVIAHHEHARIDVVEVDPLMTGIARERFFLGRLVDEYGACASGRLGLINADAVAYLEECAKAGRRYNAILNDCFAAGKAVGALTSAAAARLVHTCLVPDGMYLTNVVSPLEGARAASLMTLVSQLGEEFAHVLALPSPDAEPQDEDNVMVIATNSERNVPGAIRLVDQVG